MAKHLSKKREDAAEHLTYAVARAFAGDTASTVWSALASQSLEDSELVCVVDEHQRLLGQAPPGLEGHRVHHVGNHPGRRLQQPRGNPRP